MSYEYRLKAILLVNHILAITGLYVAGFSGWLWLTLAGWILFGKVGGEIGLHRYLAHQSFETGPLRRKLLVFLTATAMFVYAGLDPDTWGMIAMCYIGGQSAIDFAKIWKG